MSYLKKNYYKFKMSEEILKNENRIGGFLKFVFGDLCPLLDGIYAISRD